MNTKDLNIIPNSNDPPSVTEYTIEGKIYTVTRYFSGGKDMEDILTELAYRQADREFNLNTKGNTPKDLMS